MPLTGYYAGLPLDFGAHFQSLLNTMHSFALCVTAFLATGSFFREAVAQTGSQYTLGLGALLKQIFQLLLLIQGTAGIADITGPVVETNMVSLLNISLVDEPYP